MVFIIFCGTLPILNEIDFCSPTRWNILLNKLQKVTFHKIQNQLHTRYIFRFSKPHSGDQ